MRNVAQDAAKAKDKKAALGTDIVIENFSKEDINAFDVLDDLNDVDKKTQKAFLKVGVDTNSEERAGSFIQMDHSPIFSGKFAISLAYISAPSHVLHSHHLS